MQVEQFNLKESELNSNIDCKIKDQAQLVMVFSSRALLLNASNINHIKENFKNSQIVFCSTSGNIYNEYLEENTYVINVIHFERSKLEIAKIKLNQDEDSFSAGKRLAKLIAKDGLKHIMIFSDGLFVNGTDLVKGINDDHVNKIAITGGLAGDGVDFKQTLVGLNNLPEEKQIVIIGFYGDNLAIGYGSMGGWSAFGAERVITKSKGNVLYELDNQSALELYKKYLGDDHAKNLPSSGLLFPLSIRHKDDTKTLVRTLLAVNESDQSMTFAGDIPEGNISRFMKCTDEDLINGAAEAAENCLEKTDKISPSLAIMVSCVGRKLVLKQGVEEELEAVKSVVGDKAILTGFYSYGEICPTINSSFSDLHNQTMTITTFYEK